VPAIPFRSTLEAAVEKSAATQFQNRDGKPTIELLLDAHSIFTKCSDKKTLKIKAPMKKKKATNPHIAHARSSTPRQANTRLLVPPSEKN
jgi:hypothetical protein